MGWDGDGVIGACRYLTSFRFRELTLSVDVVLASKHFLCISTSIERSFVELLMAVEWLRGILVKKLKRLKGDGPPHTIASRSFCRDIIAIEIPLP